jgi:hypothetical protein
MLVMPGSLFESGLFLVSLINLILISPEPWSLRPAGNPWDRWTRLGSYCSAHQLTVYKVLCIGQSKFILISVIVVFYLTHLVHDLKFNGSNLQESPHLAIQKNRESCKALMDEGLWQGAAEQLLWHLKPFGRHICTEQNTALCCGYREMVYIFEVTL